MTKEERLSAFNVNMARDGQLSHDFEAFEKERCIPHEAYKSMTRKWLVADYEAGGRCNAISKPRFDELTLYRCRIPQPIHGPWLC